MTNNQASAERARELRPCDACGGTGRIEHFAGASKHGDRYVSVRCHDCGGTGVLPALTERLSGPGAGVEEAVAGLHAFYVRAAAYEECARLVERFDLDESDDYLEDIAAAIRALSAPARDGEGLTYADVDVRALQSATLQAFYDRDDKDVSDVELAASILNAAGVKLSNEAEQGRKAAQEKHAAILAALPQEP